MKNFKINNQEKDCCGQKRKNYPPGQYEGGIERETKRLSALFLKIAQFINSKIN